MKWTAKVIGKRWWAVAGLCLLSSLLSLGGVAQTLALRNFIDQAAAGSRDGFLTGFGVYLCLILFQLFGGAANNLLSSAVSIKAYNDLRRRMLSTIMTRRYASLRDYRTGDFMQLLSDDCDVVVASTIGLILGAFSILAQMLGAIACLGMLQGGLVLILLICFFGMILAAMPLRRMVKKHHIRVMEASGGVKSVLQESLGNLQIIRSFQATRGIEKWVCTAMEHFRKVRMRQLCISQAMSSGSSLALNVAYIIGIIWGGIGMAEGRLTFGTFMAIWQLIGQITGPALSVSGMIPQYYTITASAERLQEIENLPAEKQNPATDWKRVEENFSEIRCEGLNFSYDTEHPEETRILSGLDFTVNRGDVIAITGESGIGKSTLLKLLLGIYDPEDESIILRGRDESRTVLDAGARSMISYVPQGNYLMSGSIREAVHFWQKEKIDEEKIVEACKIAEADEMIRQQEKGYDTQLGERGAGLSEGQLQRLAIARAIYSEKPVLLLDEATSALDEATEAKVLQNLQQLQNRTVIIVTHRKAALDICNRIVEMDNGRIREIHAK